MDSLITAAAHALAIGDPLGALKFIALRDDPPALALRGTAMAQLGDVVRARALLRQAGRAYGAREVVSRARCAVAEAEIALASRDLGWSPTALDSARIALEDHGDHINAAHARYLGIRRLLLIGRIDEAEQLLRHCSPRAIPARLRAIHELIVAGIAVRRVQAAAARSALGRAARAAQLSGIPALVSEVQAAADILRAPAARVLRRGGERVLRLGDIEKLLSSESVVVDACRFRVRQGRMIVDLSGRPILFALVRALAEGWPADVSRESLAASAFRARRIDESYRARLRVEIGRLRKALRSVASVVATRDGFLIASVRGRELVVLAQIVEDEHAGVLALLNDGESWSSSALSLALDVSPRTVQRALGSLLAAGQVQAFGRGRSRRWISRPPLGFTTALLLPAPLPSG